MLKQNQLTSMLICFPKLGHRCRQASINYSKKARETCDSIQFATFDRTQTLFLSCRRWSTSSRREEVLVIWKGDRRATSNRRSDLRISQEPSAVCKHCPEFADPPPDNHLDVRTNPYADSPIRPLLVYQVNEMVCEISARENGRGLARGRID